MQLRRDRLRCEPTRWVAAGPRPRLCSTFAGLALLAAGGLSLSSCSTVDFGPIDECKEDADCGAGSVCSVAQGNICVPEQLPPRAVLGFDIREGAVRVELAGCDPEVETELGGSELLVQRRDDIVEDYSLRALVKRSVENCGGDECSGECDEEALTCTEALDSTLSAAQRSRLGLAATEVGPLAYDTTPEDMPLPEGELPPAVTLTWPRYESEAPSAHAALTLTLDPSDESSGPAKLARVIAEGAVGSGAEGELEVTSLLRCQRGLVAGESAVRTLSGSPVAGATLEFAYDEAIAASSTVLGGTGPSCADDEDCSPGWACDTEAGRCGLDLDGVSAGSTVSLENGGFMPAWVYTYCEGTVAPPADPLTRSFTVRATAPSDSGLPNMTYSLEVDFADPPSVDADRRVPLADVGFCFPDWQPPQTVSFELSGAPVELLDHEQLGVYSCCSTACLPSDPTAEPIPPPSIDSCANFEAVRFETRWTNNQQPAWGIAGCTDTALNSVGANGRYSREIKTCDEDEGCSVALTPGEADEGSRSYLYTVVQPNGSVFRSYRDVIEMTPESTDFGVFELRPRVIVSGRIECPDVLRCDATNAVVAAERLRVEGDETDPPGPYEFSARADTGGNFVLPVDPGVYVLTAYPAVGKAGGPAPYAVLDLREDSSLVEIVEGVPKVDRSDQPFMLEEGLLVRAQLRDFDFATTVVPIDLGSWNYQEGDFGYDLNDPETCYSPAGSPQRGCGIRRLRPSDTPISLLLSKRFQFTARSTGPSQCSG